MFFHMPYFKQPTENPHLYTPTHTHVCIAIFVRTLINIMHFSAPSPNPNDQNLMPNSRSYPRFNLNLILAQTLKPRLNPQKPGNIVRADQNVLTSQK